MKDLSEIIYVLMREVGLHLNQAIGILELFFSNHAETERLLGICVKHKDFAAIQKQAHQLKGTTANLRMSCISDIASSLETAAKEFDIGLCEKYIIDL